jgi:hypothetical protein
MLASSERSWRRSNVSIWSFEKTKPSSAGLYGAGLRRVRPDAAFHLSDAEREEVGLDGGGAVDAPGGIDDGLDELSFGGAFGLAILEERLGVALVGGVVLGGQDRRRGRWSGVRHWGLLILASHISFNSRFSTRGGGAMGWKLGSCWMGMEKRGCPCGDRLAGERAMAVYA